MYQTHDPMVMGLITGLGNFSSKVIFAPHAFHACEKSIHSLEKKVMRRHYWFEKANKHMHSCTDGHGMT